MLGACGPCERQLKRDGETPHGPQAEILTSGDLARRRRVRVASGRAGQIFGPPSRGQLSGFCGLQFVRPQLAASVEIQVAGAGSPNASRYP